MRITKAEFIKSADNLQNCIETKLPEIALIGRSNVGKSSFINAICNRKSLAKTSNTPGKTRLINLFNLNDEFIIADLPGYGYAKVSKTEQNRWQKILEEYLTKRENLVCVIQFIDSRIPLQDNDIKMRQWLEFNEIKIITVLTKIDSIKANEKAKALKDLQSVFHDVPTPFSAKSKSGVKEVMNIVSEIIKTPIERSQES